MEIESPSQVEVKDLPDYSLRREEQILKELGYDKNRIFVLVQTQYGSVSRLQITEVSLEYLSRNYGANIIQHSSSPDSKGFAPPEEMHLGKWAGEWASIGDWCTIEHGTLFFTRVA